MPTRLAGYYKYKAGETYTDKFSKVVEGKHDDFAIYAVLYEVTPQVPYLDGTNSLSNENIVLKAELDNRKETDVWTHFAIDFKPVDGRKNRCKEVGRRQIQFSNNYVVKQRWGYFQRCNRQHSLCRRNGTLLQINLYSKKKKMKTTNIIARMAAATLLLCVAITTWAQQEKTPTGNLKCGLA